MSNKRKHIEITMSLNQIRAFNPCADSWKKLLKAQGKTEADDIQIPLKDILKNNGIQDAIWCFRVNWFEHKTIYMQFVNNCAKRAQKYADSAAYAADAAAAAYAAASAAFYADSAASYASYAADAAAAAYAAAAASYAASYAADAAFYAASYAADAAFYAERNKQYKSLMTLLSNHSF